MDPSPKFGDSSLQEWNNGQGKRKLDGTKEVEKVPLRISNLRWENSHGSLLKRHVYLSEITPLDRHLILEYVSPLWTTFKHHSTHHQPHENTLVFFISDLEQFTYRIPRATKFILPMKIRPKLIRNCETFPHFVSRTDNYHFKFNASHGYTMTLQLKFVTYFTALSFWFWTL